MRRSTAALQRGVVLFIALIILVAMSLAGIALMRGIDTGTIIASNLAFRQSTTFVGDLGVEAGRAWLTAQPAGDLYNDRLTGTSAYYATWRDDIDLLNNDARPDFDWSSAGPSVNVTSGPFAPPAGYTVRYVIHRLCSTTGDPAAMTTCLKTVGAASGTSAGSKGAAAYGSYALAAPVSAVYRITVQVTGPRNARSYVQSVVF
jgi:hypothetical protein